MIVKVARWWVLSTTVKIIKWRAYRALEMIPSKTAIQTFSRTEKRRTAKIEMSFTTGLVRDAEVSLILKFVTTNVAGSVKMLRWTEMMQEMIAHEQ